MVAFGGAGPAHASQVARILGIRQVIIPLAAGVTSAIGCLAAPLSFEFVRAFPGRLDDVPWAEITALFAALEQQGRALLGEAGVAASAVRISRAADMRLVGQIHEITVPLPDNGPSADQVAALKQAFYHIYRELYSRAYERLPIEVVNWRLVAAAPPPDIRLAQHPVALETSAAAALKGHRPAYFPEAGGFVDTPVYDRYRLPAGAQVRGPAILEEQESTVIIGPNDTAYTDAYLSIIIQVG
jgi:N-methylhydantoinase A/oxoprolinase/acetone carboxylase beta subunit